jgi:hypothetical protein
VRGSGKPTGRRSFVAWGVEVVLTAHVDADDDRAAGSETVEVRIKCRGAD